MSIAAVSKSIKEKALEIGFDLIGISPVDSFLENQFYKVWLAKGFAGEMKYMEKEPDKRENIRNILPEAKSVISCGLNYNTNYPYSMNVTEKQKGWISRYAWGGDYHDIMKKKLQILLEFIKANSPQEIEARVYVDTGPVLDRCGTCTRCIDACPTGALLDPYVLDSRLCISYLTIEFRGMIPVELGGKIGNNIFGCDICQDVCPWNRRAKVTDESSFQPREGLFNPDLAALSKLTEEDFRMVFKGNPIKRAKRKGLLRNIVVAMGNSGLEEFIPYLKESLKDKDPLVRAHSAWALWKLDGKDSREILSNHLDVETEPMVMDEIVSILNMNG